MIRRLIILLLIVGCGTTEPETEYKICIVNAMSASTVQDGGTIYCYPQTPKTECDDLNENTTLTTLAYATFTNWNEAASCEEWCENNIFLACYECDGNNQPQECSEFTFTQP